MQVRDCIVCPNCGRMIPFARISFLASYEQRAYEAWDYANQARDVSDQWQQTLAASRESVRQEAWLIPGPTPVSPDLSGSKKTHKTTAPAAATPRTRVRAPKTHKTTAPAAATPRTRVRAPKTHKSSVPTAVILQGTGAVMVLAAIVLVTAVAWTVLPLFAQVLLLCTIVAALGAITIWSRTRIPTTSLVMAILTAAAFAVVTAELPVLVSTIDLRWYPTLASMVGCALLILVGRWAKVTAWSHIGVATLPLVAILLTTAIVQDFSTALALAAAVWISGAQAMALLLFADRQRMQDSETATTAFWAGVTLAAVAVLAGAASLLAYLQILSQASYLDQAAVALGILALCPVLWATARVWGRRSATRSTEPAPWWVLLGPLALAVAASPAQIDSVLLALLPAMGLAVVWFLGLLLPRIGYAPASWAQAGQQLQLAGPVLFVAWSALIASIAPWTGEFGWVAFLAISQAFGWGLAVTSADNRSGIGFGIGGALSVTAWAGTWFAGYLGDSLPALTLPVAAFTLIWGTAGQRLFPAVGQQTLWRCAVLWLAAWPLLLTTWFSYVDTDVLTLGYLPLVVVLGLIGIPASWGSRGLWTVTVANAGLAVFLYVEVALSRAAISIPEVYLLAPALALLVALTVAHLEGLVDRYLGITVASAVVLLPSYILAVVQWAPSEGFSTALPSSFSDFALARILLLLGVLSVATGVTWQRNRIVAAFAGSAAVFLGLWWYVGWLADTSAQSVLEAWTIPIAVAVTVVGWLWLRTTSSPEQVRSLGINVAGLVVLLPSYILAVVQWAPSEGFSTALPSSFSDFALARILLLLGVLSVATGVTWQRNRIVAAFAGSAAVFLGLWWYVGWLADTSAQSVLEAWTIPIAVAVTVVGWLWLRTTSSPEQARYRVWLLAPALLALLATTAESLPVPLSGAATGDTVRVVIVLVAWWVLVVLLRFKPLAAGLSALIAVGVTWLQVARLIDGQYPQAPLEAYTWSGAVALGAATVLFLKLRPMKVSSMLTLGPAMTLLLVPTAVSAWTWPDGAASWRGWFVLVVGAALLIFGVMAKQAGAIVPAIIAIGIIVIPVLTKLSADLPAWVPLAVAGVGLLLVGARLESLRRSGRSLAHWATTLQ